jgi:hypothetical protein
MWIFHMAGLAHPYEDDRYLSDTAATAVIRIVVCRPIATRAANAALLRWWFGTTAAKAARARVAWVIVGRPIRATGATTIYGATA